MFVKRLDTLVTFHCPQLQQPVGTTTTMPFKHVCTPQYHVFLYVTRISTNIPWQELHTTWQEMYSQYWRLVTLKCLYHSRHLYHTSTHTISFTICILNIAMWITFTQLKSDKAHRRMVESADPVARTYMTRYDTTFASWWYFNCITQTNSNWTYCITWSTGENRTHQMPFVWPLHTPSRDRLVVLHTCTHTHIVTLELG